MVEAAGEVMSNGIVEVAATFRKCFPNTKYQCFNAKRRFLQLPVVIFERSMEGKGSQKLYMIEQQTGLDYVKLVTLFNKLIPSSKSSIGLNKDSLKALCELASTESDRNLIRYTACQSSNLSREEHQ